MMTDTQYQAHCDFMARRDAIITAAQAQPATHQTVCPAWHGCPIPVDTPLIASAELQALFDAQAKSPTTARWFIIADGHENICHLWPDEVTAK